MRDIDIQINKARISSFHVYLKDNLPRVSATIELLTIAGMKISEYSIDSESWQESNKFDLPSSIINPILKITDDLEKIVATHCQSSQKLIAEVINAN